MSRKIRDSQKMKTIIHKSLFASIGALLLTLTGCIDVKQDIWINEDGSGKFVFDVGLSKQFKAMMDLQKGFGDLEGLEDDGEGNDNGLNEIPFSESPEKVVEELLQRTVKAAKGAAEGTETTL